MDRDFFLDYLLWPSFFSKKLNSIYSDAVFDCLKYRNFFFREFYNNFDLDYIVSNGFNSFNLNIISDSAKTYAIHYDKFNHTYLINFLKKSNF